MTDVHNVEVFKFQINRVPIIYIDRKICDTRVSEMYRSSYTCDGGGLTDFFV